MKKMILLLSVSFAFLQANAQDTCNSALTVTVGVYIVTTVNGSDVPSPICAQNGAGASDGEWYKYIPAQDFSVTVTTDLPVNVGKDTRVHIYSGTCGSLTCVTGDDDGGSGNLSIVTFTAFQGETYYIAFDNRW